MRTDIARMIAPVAVMAALAWAAPGRGQTLDIEIPIPDPGKSAPENKDSGKRKLQQRNDVHRGAKRSARPPLDDAPPAAGPTAELSLPENVGEDLGGPELAAPSNRARRSWDAAANDDSGPGPAWANPAGIPLREPQGAETAPKPETREKQPPAKTPTAAKKSKNRAESAKTSSGHNGWLSRRLQAGRHEGAEEESPPLVARRHREKRS